MNDVFDAFLASQLEEFDLALNTNKRLFLDEIYRQGRGVAPQVEVPDELRRRRTAALWAGLRRIYLHEAEAEPGPEDLALGEPSPETRLPIRARRRAPRAPNDLNALDPPVSGHPDDPDDASMGPGISRAPPNAGNDVEVFELTGVVVKFCFASM